ncbi:hypothetical protein ZOSMA_59G00140 [Zostera marina]|uniref:Uncharacterized protein n=1 Tax=Zostera marina TaxID=29655 RepID=A0A0K9NUI9_ZOSMR|nr:hypothetical protein ZOSMA_59G00140 [Zostera marina]
MANEGSQELDVNQLIDDLTAAHTEFETIHQKCITDGINVNRVPNHDQIIPSRPRPSPVPNMVDENFIMDDINVNHVNPNYVQIMPPRPRPSPIPNMIDGHFIRDGINLNRVPNHVQIMPHRTRPSLIGNMIDGHFVVDGISVYHVNRVQNRNRYPHHNLRRNLACTWWRSS